jgi:hypothetical protein
MKKILVFFFLQFYFGLSAQTIELNADIKTQDNSMGWLDEEGVREHDGKLYAIETSMNGFKTRKSIAKRLEKRVDEYVKRKGIEIEFDNESWRPPAPGTPSKLTRIYLIANAKMTKNQALNKIKELKEYLEMGIITQEEFDKKAAELKKVILGN